LKRPVPPTIVIDEYVIFDRPVTAVMGTGVALGAGRAVGVGLAGVDAVDRARDGATGLGDGACDGAGGAPGAQPASRKMMVGPTTTRRALMWAFMPPFPPPWERTPSARSWSRGQVRETDEALAGVAEHRAVRGHGRHSHDRHVRPCVGERPRLPIKTGDLHGPPRGGVPT